MPATRRKDPIPARLSVGSRASRSGPAGRAEDVARAEPLLARLSNRHAHLGASGAGQTVKQINQILCACNFLAVAEALRFAEGRGVDAETIPDALAGGRADSRILQEFMAKMARRDFSPTGRIDNMLKDLEIAQAAALAKQIPMPVTSLIADLHRMLVAGGFGARDSAEYVRLFDLGADCSTVD